ncbi:MAG: hypothetical protein AAF215_15840 [Cyanobacteria bacterium P01_A01_bin.123]
MVIRLKAIAIANVGALLGSVSIGVASANGAQFSADFSVDIVSGDFLLGETFLGQVIYDDQFLTGVGTELIDLASGLVSLDFTYVGADLTTPVTYTEADDDISAGFPLATFQDGELAGLDYSVSITPNLAFQFREEPLGSGNFEFFTDDFATFQTNTGTVAFAEPNPVTEPTAVPEPALLTGLVVMAGAAALKRSLRN